nr:gonadotropin releasing hormone [Corbicula leana]
MHSCTAMLLVATVAMVTIHTVSGQSYHFSNGWNPGKRSMQEPVCHFRPEIKSLIFRLIEEEAYRMLSDASCLSGIPPLRNLLKKDVAYPLPLDDQK